MKVKKSKSVHIETGRYAAELSDYEDTVIVPKSGKNKGKRLSCIKVSFEILDEPGQEDVAGITLNKTLWYNLDKNDNVCMGGSSIQVIEAMQGTMDELEKSDDLEDLLGTKVYLQVVGAEEDDGYPDIPRVEAYNEQPIKDKPDKKKKSETKPKKEKPSEEDDEEPGEEKKAKTDAFDFD